MRGWRGGAAALRERSAARRRVRVAALAEPVPGTDSTVPVRTRVGAVMPLTRCSSASDTPCWRAML